jgi:hypothetical protein
MTPLQRSRERSAARSRCEVSHRHRFHHFDGQSATTMQERERKARRGVGSVPAAWAARTPRPCGYGASASAARCRRIGLSIPLDGDILRSPRLSRSACLGKTWADRGSILPPRLAWVNRAEAVVVYHPPSLFPPPRSRMRDDAGRGSIQKQRPAESPRGAAWGKRCTNASTLGQACNSAEQNLGISCRGVAPCADQGYCTRVEHVARH